jgi:hypothetical protein
LFFLFFRFRCRKIEDQKEKQKQKKAALHRRTAAAAPKILGRLLSSARGLAVPSRDSVVFHRELLRKS